jgi:hypothetical protein
MRQEHRAGEKLFVDYAAQTAEVVDRRTGEIRQAQIFVAVLGASNYTYAEATWTQQLPDWIGSHVRAFEFLGASLRGRIHGVTRKAYPVTPLRRSSNLTNQSQAATLQAVLPARILNAMFAPDRNSMRRVFVDAWRKFQNNEPLQPLEQVVAEVVKQHPEYHRLLNAGENVLDREFLPEGGQTNPFLHMGMHISLQEQIGTDRPPGIRDLHRRLSLQQGDAHEAEHRMMECLGHSLWQAQRNGGMPDEQAYLDCLRNLAGRP